MSKHDGHKQVDDLLVIFKLEYHQNMYKTEALQVFSKNCP